MDKMSMPHQAMQNKDEQEQPFKELLWERIRGEAEQAISLDGTMTAFLVETILNHQTITDAVIHRIAVRLGGREFSSLFLFNEFHQLITTNPEIEDQFCADILATFNRDPACHRTIEPVIFFKGFQGLQVHRLNHLLWQQNRKDFAFTLQSLCSEIFQIDIHPAVKVGSGIMLDHATGLVVGETAIIEDQVSILQGVTLGGTGKEELDRHPKIRHGVLIGAGAKILGNIEIGHCSRVAAGSVVLKPVPPKTTVAGVPARVIGPAPCTEPSLDMNQVFTTDNDNQGGKEPDRSV